jgi:hypothetical protein
MDNQIAIMNEYKSIAVELVKSNLIPKNFKQVQDAWFAILYGREMGLSPIYSLSNISVINGKPSLSADGMLAVVKSSPEYGGIEVTSTDTACKVTLKRLYKTGVVDITTAEFTIEDAKKAGLCDSPGCMYKKYPKRMLRARAISYACRDAFGDVLAGNYSEEELRGGAETAEPIEPKIIDAVAIEPQQAPVSPVELAQAYKACNDLLNSFSMVNTETEEYRSAIKAAFQSKSLNTLKDIETVLQERKAKVIKSMNRKPEVPETPFTPVEPEPVAEVQESPEPLTAPAPISELKIDAINALSALMASNASYQVNHACASAKKQLGIQFEGLDWVEGIKACHVSDKKLLDATKYWQDAITKTKKTRDAAPVNPYTKEAAQAMIDKYADDNPRKAELLQCLAEAETQPGGYELIIQACQDDMKKES